MYRLQLTVAAAPYRISRLSAGPLLRAVVIFKGDFTVMYAVIQTGGKQYRVAQGSTIKVEKLDAETGASVELDRVLMVADGDDIKVGAPFLEGGKVTATIKSHCLLYTSPSPRDRG